MNRTTTSLVAVAAVVVILAAARTAQEIVLPFLLAVFIAIIAAAPMTWLRDKGISTALLTTAYGLIVAFVTQPFYNYFNSRVVGYTRQIETASNILFETLDEMDTGDSAAAG